MVSHSSHPGPSEWNEGDDGPRFYQENGRYYVDEPLSTDSFPAPSGHVVVIFHPETNSHEVAPAIGIQHVVVRVWEWEPSGPGDQPETIPTAEDPAGWRPVNYVHLTGPVILHDGLPMSLAHGQFVPGKDPLWSLCPRSEIAGASERLAQLARERQRD
jgi:hypothetical protein